MDGALQRLSSYNGLCTVIFVVNVNTRPRDQNIRGLNWPTEWKPMVLLYTLVAVQIVRSKLFSLQLDNLFMKITVFEKTWKASVAGQQRL